MQVGARRGQKLCEDRNLRQESACRQQDNHQGVHDAFSHYRAKTFGKGHTITALQASATHHLANTRNYETRGIGQEDGILGRTASWTLTQGLQCQSPTPGTNLLSQHSKDKAEKHPPPVHFGLDDAEKVQPVSPSIHPPKDADGQNERKDEL